MAPIETIFSRRTAWNLRPNRLSLALEAMRGSGREVLDLTVANPTRVGLPIFAEETLRALSHESSLVYDPDPRGLASARNAIAAWYGRRSVRLDPEALVLCASTSEAYSWLFKLLCDPGDEVLIPTPSYPLFEFLAGLEGVRLSPYSLSWDGRWSLDVRALEKLVTERTRGIVLVHPNNPTGNYVRGDVLTELDSLCRRRGLALISDEVFGEYAWGNVPDRAGAVAEVTECLSFSMSGLSKLAGFPQLKAAWIWVGGARALSLPALERLETVADTFLSIGTPVQRGLGELLEIGDRVRAGIQSRVKANLGAVARFIDKAPAASLVPGEGGWSAVLRLPAVMSDEEWALELVEHEGVLVQPGYFFEFALPAILVVSLLAPEDVFQEGMARMAESVNRYGR